MSYVVGIDVGTTWTAAAVGRHGVEPEVAWLGARAAAVPTVVALQDDGNLAVGEAAVRRGAADPRLVAREFKRRIGDDVPLLLGGQPWSPEALSGAVVRWVLARVAEREGGPAGDVVLTHPANWGPLRRELFEQSAPAGARFVTEPEAAAAHYASGERIADGAVVAVYDLGGGTFDATVLEKVGSGFRMLGTPGGIDRLGGLDVDAALLEHVAAGLGVSWADLDADDPVVRDAVTRLRRDVVDAKEALSEDVDAVVPVRLPSLTADVRVTRGELEALVRPMIERSADALAGAVDAAGITAEDVDRILLVGGASRMPVVSEVLASRFGRPLAVDAHPKHAVALGAARTGRGVAPVEAPAAAPTPPPTEPAPTRPPRATPGRRPLVVGAGAAGVAAVVVAALALSGDGGGDGETALTFCGHLRGLLGEVADGNLATRDGIDGIGDTVGDMGDAATDDEQGATADALEAIVDAADPADAEANTAAIGDAVAEAGASCGIDPAVTVHGGPDLADLVGQWSFEGSATACVGLDDTGCEPYATLYDELVLIECDEDACTAALGEGDAVPFEGSIAEGELDAVDGVTCDGEDVATTWRLQVTTTDDDRTTWNGTVAFEAVEDLGCGPQRVVVAGGAVGA